ncbi:MAG: threonylcarbamoyl-AMP synthase [Muribaculaceae bacterium]|nr:threonylcarbamoyl-AMP synthase [Muribaculaceae bacterium]
MDTLKIWNDNPSDRQLDEIISIIDNGDLVILPTDTLYAIVCDALSPKAIEQLCRLKGIKPDKTHLSIICADISMAAEYARIDNAAFKMLRSNTPGAFTFLFPTASSLPKAFKGRKVVGIRIPDCVTDLKLVERLRRPLLTTSIEFDDEDYAINPELVAEAYEGRVALTVDGGDGGTEPSTVIDCTNRDFEIVRQGKGELI